MASHSDELHATAVTVQCPYCHAPRGQLCRNNTVSPPTTTRIPHNARLTLAEEVPF